MECWRALSSKSCWKTGSAIEWQNRAHEGLTDPLLPGQCLTPNEMFRAYCRVAPEIHVPFGVDDFIGLLQAKKCTLQDYNFARRVYKSNGLTELCAAGAGGEGASRPCRIRCDPHNALFIWVEHAGEFIPFRVAPDMLDEPMGGDVWREARSSDTDVAREARADAAYRAPALPSSRPFAYRTIRLMCENCSRKKGAHQ